MKVLELRDSGSRNFDSIFVTTKKDYTFLLRKEDKRRKKNYRYVLDLYLYSIGDEEKYYRLNFKLNIYLIIK